MIDQSRITSKKFRPEDMLRLVGTTPEVASQARLNQMAGPAKSVYLDNELFYCGGIRIRGVGEAWVAYSPESLENLRYIIPATREHIDNMSRENNLWRIWAEVTKNDEKHKTFLKHMNFTEVPAWCRLL